MAQIRATIQLGNFPSGEDITVAIPLEGFMYREVRVPLDFPSENADPITANFICTPPKIILKTMADRREFSEQIAKQLTDYIMYALAGNDTEMGYPKPR